jgi:hypothetical protein
MRNKFATAIPSNPYGGTGINDWYANHEQDKLKSHLIELN